ncbi:hypothetical protein LQV63_13765 [Paenibacillus profundus]|uniref:DUF4134 domain-containing protein n=1 Tax=Paenibacillus profundus TaxID=1173085 RepID=A0ABS8YIU3_9BACL|nr:hypothetical protein [Paenibacillus profundus]MCE5170378.1 hypothetical protein [Paenibacillus profundus]
MSFSYLPWPLFVILVFSCAFITIRLVVKEPNRYPKVAVLGMVLVGVGGILLGINKILKNYNLMSDKLWMVEMIAIFCSLVAGVCILAGAYIKTKNDPDKHKMVLACIFIVVAVLLMVGVIGILANFT